MSARIKGSVPETATPSARQARCRRLVTRDRSYIRRRPHDHWRASQMTRRSTPWLATGDGNAKSFHDAARPAREQRVLLSAPGQGPKQSAHRDVRAVCRRCRPSRRGRWRGRRQAAPIRYFSPSNSFRTASKMVRTERRGSDVTGQSWGPALDCDRRFSGARARVGTLIAEGKEVPSQAIASRIF
jgi:hypothetical protein